MKIFSTEDEWEWLEETENKYGRAFILVMICLKMICLLGLLIALGCLAVSMTIDLFKY